MVRVTTTVIVFSFAVIFPFGNHKVIIMHINSVKSLRLVLIRLPLGQSIVHVQHSSVVEYMVCWLDDVPVLDFPVLVAVCLGTPSAPFVRLRAVSGNTNTTCLASEALLPGFHCSRGVGLQGLFRVVAMRPADLPSFPVNGMNEGGS